MHGIDNPMQKFLQNSLFESTGLYGSSSIREIDLQSGSTAYKKQRLQNNAQGLAKSLRGSGTGSQPSLWRKLNEINSPTLILVGEEDPKFRSLAVRLNSGISKSEIVVVPESGHACHLENPDFTLEMIETFLEEVLSR